MKKMNSIISVIVLMLLQVLVMPVFSQSVGIGGTSFTPNVSSMLEIQSTSKGLLIPRMLKAERDLIGTPATGLLIYQTDNTPGFYYYDGAAWTRVGSGGTGWDILGNTGTTAGTNFVGTTDGIGLAFKTNNNEWMRLQTTGELTIGATTSTGSKLDVHQTSGVAGRFTTYGSNNYIQLRRTQGTQGTPTSVTANGTLLGRIDAEGYNSTVPSFNTSSTIKFEMDAASTSATDMPGRIVFMTIPDNSVTGFPIERMRIRNNGTIQIGDSAAVPTGSSAKKLWVINSAGAGTGYTSDLSAGAIYGSGGSNSYNFGVIGYNNLLASGLNYAVRSGGVLGSIPLGTTWGSLAYFSNSSTLYGGYFTSAIPAPGTGFMPNATLQGIGTGAIGDLMGSWSRGELFGSTSMGDMYASYNLGNEYTSGVSADIVTNNNQRMPAYSVTSNEVKVYGNGKAKLVNGVCKVTFDKSFQNLISLQENPTITVSALGECEGIFIVSFDKDGFTVKEFHNGQSNVEFTWIAVAKRVDADKVSKLPEAIKDKDFDVNMKGVMFNENIKDKSAKPIWWDGNKLRFDTPPSLNTNPKSNKF